MSNIRIQLLNVINKEDRGSMNFIIARYILENLERKRAVSTKELAGECNVSKSSISRFCRKLGYEDFTELQYAIASYNSFVDRRFANLDGDDIGDLTQNYFQCIEDVSVHFKKLPGMKTLERLIEDIHDYKEVVLMGQVQSSFSAFSLQHNLTLLRKFVYSTQDFNEQKELLETLDDNSLVIIFSAGGRFIERVLDGMSVMKRRHLPKIYMITASKTKHLPFVHTYIELMDSYSYISPVILEIYSNLIPLIYRKKYIETS